MINEINPSLEIEIDKSKDVQSLKSIVTDINKIGKNATINIIQNQDISDKQKYLSLWEENNRLHTILNKIENKLSALERNQDIYHNYVIYCYGKDKWIPFLKSLNEEKIKFIKTVESRVTPGSGTFTGRVEHTIVFKVLDQDNQKFLELVEKHSIEIE